MNNKILYITRPYYPCNASGAHRATKTVKYLVRQGWDVTVLCADWIRAKDNYFFDKSLVSMKYGIVIGVPFKSPRLKSLSGILNYFVSKVFPLYAPPVFFIKMLIAGLRLSKSNNFDMIIASSPPLMTLKIATILSYVKKIPWIADLRDLSGELVTNPNYLVRRSIDSESSVINSAKLLITVSSHLARTLQEKHGKQTFVITNGYDQEDYHGIKPNINKQLTIMYAGSISYSTLSFEPFFDSLDYLLASVDKNIDIKVEFYGVQPSQLNIHVAGRACEKLISANGRIDYKEVIAKLQTADLLLFLPHTGVKGIMTGKIFEYIGSGTPILSVPGDYDETDKLLNKTKRGLIGRNYLQVADIIMSYYRNRESTKPVLSNKLSDIHKYSREYQTKILSDILIKNLNRLKVD